MDVPAINYTRTPDGATLAYTVFGRGPRLVHMPPNATNVQTEWAVDGIRAWHELLGQHFEVVRYDTRGTGLSSRDCPFPDRTERRVDLEAVIEATRSRDFVLLAPNMSGPAAGLFAVQHPELVSLLVLFNTTSGLFAERGPGIATHMHALHEIDSQLWLEAFSHSAVGWRDTDAARQYARLLSEGIDLDRHTDFVLRNREGEVARPEDLAVRTLILFRSEGRRNAGLDTVTDLAHRLADGSVRFIGGEASVPWAEDTERIVTSIREHLAAQPRLSHSTPSGFQTILFTDLEASTPLTQRLGDEGAQEILRGHNASVRRALEEHGGREVKHTGDGIMASFPSAVAAVTAALQIQRELAGGEVRVRVGLNAGEPIAEDDDLFGLSVIKAARIADRAEPGQVLVSRVVRELCEGKTFEFTSLGEVSLKGFDEAVELFEVSA